MIATLSQALATWNSYYGNHQALSVTIRYLHLAALLVGGGTALALDREIFGLRRSAPQMRAATIARLNSAHALVIGSLAFIVASGLLMAAADVETYLVSPTFWIKMALIVALFAAIAFEETNFKKLASGDRTAARRSKLGGVIATVAFLGVLLAAVQAFH